jgi:hypothetical protein
LGGGSLGGEEWGQKEECKGDTLHNVACATIYIGRIMGLG